MDALQSGQLRTVGGLPRVADKAGDGLVDGAVRIWTGTWNMGAKDFATFDLNDFVPKGYGLYVAGVQVSHRCAHWMS